MNLKPKLKILPTKTKSNSADLEVGSLTDKQKLIIMLNDPSYYMDPPKWVEAYNACHNITYNYKNDSVYSGKKKLQTEVYKATMRSFVVRKHIKGLSRYTLDDAIVVWMDKQSDIFLEKMRGDLKFTKQNDDLFPQLAKAMTGKEDPLDIAVLKHFVWQVRRKLFGLPVEHHIMPILYGESGGGKSWAVDKFLRPVSELRIYADFSVFSDQFMTRQFTRGYVMFLDEMARSERANIDRLKNIISATSVDYRIMRTEKLESGPQNCTFIGCSNEPVHDKIFDPNSARRYWQINCSKSLDWNVVNSLDYLALWRSIDEKQSCPIIPYLDQIRAIQDRDIRQKDPIEEWFSTMCKPKKPEASKDPTSSELYTAFGRWCRWQRFNYQAPANRFYRQMRIAIDRLGWDIVPINSNRGTVWPIAIGEDGSTAETLKSIDDILGSIPSGKPPTEF